MDKIYSRTKIRFPKVMYGGKKGNENYKKIIKIILVLIIAIFVMINMLKAINPIFEKLCIDEAKSIVTIEINRITTINVDRYQENELITIKQDGNGNIQLLQVNSRPLNNMISSITNDIQVSLNDNDTLTLSGTIQTKIRNEFDDAGINQTLHRLWLDVTCDINILTPYEIIQTQVTSELVLSENVIIGGVPNVYLNTDTN